MFNRILVICTGNICRSPMGEGLLRKALSNNSAQDITVTSAGIQAMVGYSADEQALRLMKEHGVDITGHRARQLDIDLINWAELILVMEREQKLTIELDYPSARGKVFRLGKWRGFDVPDPYRQSNEMFDVAFDLIAKGVTDWVPKLSEGTKNEK